MNNANFLYLPASLRDKFIYRIVSVDRVFEQFESRRNVLVKPHKWEDPFENFILNCKVQLPDGRYAAIGFRDEFYGQCWTLQSASDAMWRIYSPARNAVRLRSTVRKLAGSLWTRCGKWAPHEVFIGKVRYLPSRPLEEFAKGILRSEGGDLSVRLFAKTLLVKRPAFKHEREIRLIFRPHDGTDAGNDLFSYGVDLHELVDQIMIDPRMPENDGRALKQELASRTGFKGKILRSLLYAAPPSWTIPL
jgi:hypothetical protein